MAANLITVFSVRARSRPLTSLCTLTISWLAHAWAKLLSCVATSSNEDVWNPKSSSSGIVSSLAP